LNINRISTYKTCHPVSAQKMDLYQLGGCVKIEILAYHAQFRCLYAPFEGFLGFVE
jgi:hypothetical protein